MLCELDYDLNKFGNILLQIRTKGKMTQKKIQELTGIHPDTIKGLEYGQRLPSLDTINKLSELYNINVLNILTQCRFENDQYLLKVKNHINLISYNDYITDIDEVLEKLKTYNKIYSGKLNSNIKHLLRQTDYFLKLLKIKNKSDVMNVLESERLCYEALKIIHPNFDINKFDENYYSVIELRILMILTITKTRQKKHSIAIQITKHVLKQFKYHSISDPTVNQFVLQSYFTLAYQCFLTSKHLDVIDICDEGIEFARSIFTSKFLSQFYFRKGISQIFLKNPNHLESLSLSFKYLQLNQEYDLLEKYNEILTRKHNIHLMNNADIN